MAEAVRFKGPQWVAKHLLKTIITTTGHMKTTRQGIRSTKKKKDEASIELETVNKKR